MATLNKDTISAWQEGVTMFQEKDYDGAIYVLKKIPEEHQTAKVRTAREECQNGLYS